MTIEEICAKYMFFKYNLDFYKHAIAKKRTSWIKEQFLILSGALAIICDVESCNEDMKKLLNQISQMYDPCIELTEEN